MYDYKVLDANGATLALKRAVIYLALLMVIVSFALVVLYILFELYVLLVIPGCGILFSGFVIFLMGRKNDLFIYSFDKEGHLTIKTMKGKSFLFDTVKFERVKAAEYSDFKDKKTLKLCFLQSKLLQNEATDDFTHQKMLFLYEGKKVILLIDDYAMTLIMRNEQ